MNSMSKSSADYESPEESSWTMYLADFSNTNNYNDAIDRNESSSILSYTNHQPSTLIPDAACSAAGRSLPRAALENKSTSSDNLSFKKRKIKRSSSGFVDRDLEDTATSPASRSKVCNMVNQFDRQKDVTGISEETKASGKIKDEFMGFDMENGDNELKQKGLSFRLIQI